MRTAGLYERGKLALKLKRLKTPAVCSLILGETESPIKDRHNTRQRHLL